MIEMPAPRARLARNPLGWLVVRMTGANTERSRNRMTSSRPSKVGQILIDDDAVETRRARIVQQSAGIVEDAHLVTLDFERELQRAAHRGIVGDNGEHPLRRLGARWSRHILPERNRLAPSVPQRCSDAAFGALIQLNRAACDADRYSNIPAIRAMRTSSDRLRRVHLGHHVGAVDLRPSGG